MNPENTPPVNNSPMKKWGIIIIGVFLIAGITYFFTGTKLFKGAIQQRVKPLQTMDESKARSEMTKVSDYVSAINAPDAQLPESIRQEKFEKFGTWPVQAGKETAFSVKNDSPSDVEFSIPSEETGSFVKLKAEFDASTHPSEIISRGNSLDPLGRFENQTAQKPYYLTIADYSDRNSKKTTITKWCVNYGDNTPEVCFNDKQALHDYKHYYNFGTYPLTYRVEDLEGRYDIETKTIDILPPDAEREQFTFIAGCTLSQNGNIVTATSTSQISQNISRVDYTWSFNDGPEVTNQLTSQSHPYPIPASEPQQYSVLLTITSPDYSAPSGYECGTVTIDPAPAPSLTPNFTMISTENNRYLPNSVSKGNDQEAGQLITFRDNSITANNPKITEVIWDFGDGSRIKFEQDDISIIGGKINTPPVSHIYPYPSESDKFNNNNFSRAYNVTYTVKAKDLNIKPILKEFIIDNPVRASYTCTTNSYEDPSQSSRTFTLENTSSGELISEISVNLQNNTYRSSSKIVQVSVPMEFLGQFTFKATDSYGASDESIGNFHDNCSWPAEVAKPAAPNSVQLLPLQHQEVIVIPFSGTQTVENQDDDLDLLDSLNNDPGKKKDSGILDKFSPDTSEQDSNDNSTDLDPGGMVSVLSFNSSNKTNPKFKKELIPSTTSNTATSAAQVPRRTVMIAEPGATIYFKAKDCQHGVEALIIQPYVDPALTSTNSSSKSPTKTNRIEELPNQNSLVTRVEFLPEPIAKLDILGEDCPVTTTPPAGTPIDPEIRTIPLPNETTEPEVDTNWPTTPPAGTTTTPPQPTASCTINKPVVFVNEEVTATATITNVAKGEWSFGTVEKTLDINHASSSNTFQTEGSYPVTLDVTGNNNQAMKISCGTVTVNPRPVTITPPPAPEPQDVPVHSSCKVIGEKTGIIGTRFRFSGIDSIPNNISGEWDFKDGTRKESYNGVQSKEIEHTFTRSGVFPVSLTLRNQAGRTYTSASSICEITVTEPVIVTEPEPILPKCSATPTEAFVDDVFKFSAKGSTGSFTNATFDFGDQQNMTFSGTDISNINKDNPYIYRTTGEKTFKATLWNSTTKDEDTCSLNVTVKPRPVQAQDENPPTITLRGEDENPPTITLSAETGITASCTILPQTGYVNDKFKFYAGGSAGPIEKAFWIIDGINKVINFDPKDIYTHLEEQSFPQTGSYTATLTLLDKNGKGASCTKTIIVNSPSTSDKPECSDGRDNDGDGYKDFGEDPGCNSPTDDDEYNKPSRTLTECSDGKDNDGDGFKDLKDIGCEDAADDDETNPKEVIKKGEAKLPFCLAYTDPKEFTDIPDGYYAEDIIKEEASTAYSGRFRNFTGEAIFIGYPEGDDDDRVFKQDQAIRRDEVVKILELATCYADYLAEKKKIDLKVVHNDVELSRKDYWAKNFISIAANGGIVNKGGKFLPGKNINRAEFLKLLISIHNDMNGKKLIKFNEKKNVFVDVNKSNWFADYAQTAYDMGITKGFKDSKGNVRLQPDKILTRSDAAVLLYNYYVATKGKTFEESRDDEKVSRSLNDEDDEDSADRKVVR